MLGYNIPTYKGQSGEIIPVVYWLERRPSIQEVMGSNPGATTPDESRVFSQNPAHCIDLLCLQLRMLLEESTGMLNSSH